MKVPSCSRSISKEWVHFVVEEYLKKDRGLEPVPKLDIKEFSTGRGAKAGDAFNSELVTLDVKASLTEDGGTVEYHFIVKFLSTDPFNKEMNKRFQSSLKEYTIYADYVKDLNEFQSSLTSDESQIYIPDLIYGLHSEKDFVLVMENIKYNGYENRDKYLGLDFPHLKTAVIQLARFHALSYAHSKKEPFLDKYPFFKVNEDVIKVFTGFFSIFVDNALELLKTKDNKEDLVTKIEDSKEVLIDEFVMAIKPSPNVPVCVVHGDYWNNNLMFKHHEEGREDGDSAQNDTQISCKILDWGNSGWGSPIMDLQYLMHTSTTLETRREHLEDVFRCYHSTYIDVTTRAGAPVPNWSYDDFMDEWQRLSAYGFFMGMALSHGTLSKRNTFNKHLEPSVLDNSVCLPVKFLADGMKHAMAKLLVPLFLKPSLTNVATAINKKTLRPIKEELLSGSNEVMNKRVLDLITEADEKGLFSGKRKKN